MLVVHGYCQRRRQNRLDKVNERSLGRGGILRDLRCKQKAKSCAADADMAQKECRSERKARKERDAGKNIQAQTLIERADRRDLAEQQQHEHFQSSDKDVKIRDHHTAQPVDTQLAERAVHREKDRRSKDLQKAAETDLKLCRIENEEDTDDLHADRQQVIFPERLMQNKMCRRQGKDGISRVDDRCG